MKNLILRSLCIALSAIALSGCAFGEQKDTPKIEQQIDVHEQAKQASIEDILKDKTAVMYARLDDAAVGDDLLLVAYSYSDDYYTFDQKVLLYKYDQDTLKYSLIEEPSLSVGHGSGSTVIWLFSDQDNAIYNFWSTFASGIEGQKLVKEDGKYRLVKIYQGNLGDPPAIPEDKRKELDWKANIRTADKVTPEEIKDKEAQGYTVEKCTLRYLTRNEFEGLMNGKEPAPDSSEYPIEELFVQFAKDANIPERYKSKNASADLAYLDNRPKSKEGSFGLKYGPMALFDGIEVYIAFKAEVRLDRFMDFGLSVPILHDFIIL